MTVPLASAAATAVPHLAATVTAVLVPLALALVASVAVPVRLLPPGAALRLLLPANPLVAVAVGATAVVVSLTARVDMAKVASDRVVKVVVTLVSVHGRDVTSSIENC